MGQKAYLIGIRKMRESKEKALDSLEELVLLSKTAGAAVSGKVLKNLKSIDPAFYLSKGMLEDIKKAIYESGSDIAIIDVDLTPAQERNLSEYWDINIIDRTRLILDIFATRARTAEAKFQVELAILNYILPRLKGAGIMLSRTGAGIGTRGPGETKLETDRRKIRQRISHIMKKLRLLEKTQNLHRSKREKHGLSTVTLVGYTNSGKTTLLKALTGSGKGGENKLFATLGTKMGSIYNQKNEKNVIILDTVGFIQNLPAFLIKSFKTTLEEAVNSDILIHVVDPSHEDAFNKSQEVVNILDSIGSLDKPIITLLNKIDLLPEDQVKFLQIKFEQLTGRRVIPVSAKTGKNLGLLKEEIFNNLCEIKEDLKWCV